MDEHGVADLLRDLAGLPGVLMTTGGLVPLPTPSRGVQDGLVVHLCYQEPYPQLIGPELLAWFRRRVADVTEVMRSRCAGERISVISMSIRFRERGENLVLYGCDIPADQCLSVADGSEYDAGKIVMREWSHDSTVEGLLRG